MEETRKETLTRKQIERDLMKSLYSDILGTFAGALLFLILASLAGWFLKSVGLSPNWVWVPFWMLMAVLMVLLAKVVWYIVRVRRHRYVLTKDSVVDKIEGKIRSRYDYQPYTLIFNIHTKFYIPRYNNYAWSAWYCMDEKEVFRSTDLGDVFLLVGLGGKYIYMAYNLKFFDFVEETTD